MTFRLSLTFAFLLLAMPAHADWLSGKAVPGLGKKEAKAGLEEVYLVSNCAVGRAPGKARLLLTSRPVSREELMIAGPLLKIFENCMRLYRPDLTIDYRDLRGAVATVLYKQEFPSDPDFGQLDHVVRPLPTAWFKADASELALVELYMHKFGACVVAAEPRAATALLRSEAGSDQQSAAISALAPNFSTCVEEGRTLKLDPATLRSLIAQELYRGVHEWKPSSSSTPNPTTGN